MLDKTVFGRYKQGHLFTTEGICVDKNIFLPYSEIEGAKRNEFGNIVLVTKQGKEVGEFTNVYFKTDALLKWFDEYLADLYR